MLGVFYTAVYLISVIVACSGLQPSVPESIETAFLAPEALCSSALPTWEPVNVLEPSEAFLAPIEELVCFDADQALLLYKQVEDLRLYVELVKLYCASEPSKREEELVEQPSSAP